MTDCLFVYIGQRFGNSVAILVFLIIYTWQPSLAINVEGVYEFRIELLV